MGFLDSVVARSFRDLAAGRVVVFSGDRPNRGYLVKSKGEELKIKSFLKMVYVANVSILMLGGMLSNAWAIFFVHLDSPGDSAHHVLKTFSIYLLVSIIVCWLPYIFFWRSYKTALLSFASARDEVSLSGTTAVRQPWTAYAVAGFAFLLLLAIAFLVTRAK